MSDLPILRERHAYRAWRLIPTRWSDNDVYGHVNNVVYYEWFDTAVNGLLLDAGVLDFAHGESVGLVVDTACSYFESVAYPTPIEVGLSVRRIGNSSVRYQLGIFKPGQSAAIAAGHFVHVYVDRSTRRPAPLPHALRQLLEPLLLEDEEPAPAAMDATTFERIADGRRSIRAYLPRPVPRPLIEKILASASRAPSGTNAQPWQVYVLTGDVRDRVCDRLCALFDAPEQAAAYRAEYDYYPREWFSPYLERRREVGWALYGLLGIERGDSARIKAQHRRNFRFFDAPVGLLFTIDRKLTQGSWLDYGMFLQNVMLAARAHGLDTCPQAAFVQFHQVIAEELSIPENQMLVCGMALGYADPEAIENTLRTVRESVNGFANFYGF